MVSLLQLFFFSNEQNRIALSPWGLFRCSLLIPSFVCSGVAEAPSFVVV